MAKIYFKHLSMTNFMSYKFAELDLNRNGNILVGGMNQNPEDSAKSNGCGKSTIFSALSWALLGETTNGAKEVSNIYSEGKTEVSLTFDIDNNSYKIIRSRSPSNLQFFVNNENVSGKGIRDTTDIINRYIPQVHSYLLNSAIILGQGLPQKFTNNTPSGRKAVLETLAETDFMILDLRSKLEARKKELGEKKRSCEDFELQYATTKKTLENQVKQHKQSLLLLPDKGTLDRGITSLEEELKKLVSIKEEEELQLKELENNIILCKNKKEEITAEHKEEQSQLELKSIKDLEAKLIEKKAESNSLLMKIRDYENITDTCPTCGQKLPDVHKIDTTDLKVQQKELEIESHDIEVEIYNIKCENNELVRQCTEKYSAKVKEQSRLQEEYEKEFNRLRTELQHVQINITNSSNKKHSLELEKATLEEKKKNLEDEIKEKKKFIKEHDKRLYNNTIEYEETKNRLAINSKMLTLIQRDFRGYLLNNVITFIENKSKEYAMSVFGTDKLSFKLDKNNIDISYDGKDYSCLSGGEKQKLDIIVQFAIRDMLCTFLDFSSNILVLDEITDALDSIGVSRIFNLINENLTDVEAVYIISHHVDELEIPADDEIIIIKGDDKISRIV